jgi:hypothetical protein
MSLFRTRERIMTEIVDTSRMLDLVQGHPFMSIGIKSKLNELQTELHSLPEVQYEPKINLLFSGRAVSGSLGIKSSFVGKAIIPFQEIIKTQAALVRFGNVARRGQAKNAPNAELFITSLPVGSFGIELSQLESNDLFAERDVSIAMKQVIELLVAVSESDESFDTIVLNTPNRNLRNLKKFLKELVDEHSILKIESGEVGVVITEEKVEQAYNRVASTIAEDEEEIIEVIFRGILLDSGKFEVQTLKGETISGSINENIGEEMLIEYDKRYLNQGCRVHILKHKTNFKTGVVKTEYELLEILG